MIWKSCALIAVSLAIGGCGGVDEPAARAADPPEPAQRRESVFDPMTSTISRAEGVQLTVDEQAAEQRSRIEDAAR